MKKQILILLGIIILSVIGFSIYKIQKARYYQSLITTISGYVTQGETLSNILIENGVNNEQSYVIVKLMEKLYDSKKWRVSDKYELVIHKNEGILSFKFQPDPLNTYIIEKSKTGEWTSQHIKEELKKVVVGISGKIKTSLYEAIIEAKQTPDLAIDFAEIFSWQIDFLTEPRSGDLFKIIWERYEKDGKVFKNGRILTAQYLSDDKTHTAIFYPDSSGHSDYYDVNGKSLKRAFLRSPLNYRRISSYFTGKRFHPILKYFRPHLGIDYAAPKGTPIVSIGDGVVTYAGRKGGFGKFISIKHSNNYTTMYAHLSGYAKGIRTGAKVRQNQLIGYVGSTGLATGPHLDFRITQNGRFINFLRLNMPSAKSVLAKHKNEFVKLLKLYLTKLADIDKSKLHRLNID